MLTVILISTWTFFPFVVIGTLARLQTIDPELYAAAKVDGAGVVRRFIHVTLPQLRNVLFVVILLRFMFMFTKFDVIWLLNGSSGVGYYTRTLPIYTYIKTFGQLQVGAGAGHVDVHVPHAGGLRDGLLPGVPAGRGHLSP